MIKYNIPVVLGTARGGSESSKVADFVLSELGNNENVETELVKVSDYLFSKTTSAKGEPEKVKGWTDIISKADGFIFVSPEYNHSFPGELKILIDSHYDEYKGKVAGIVGVSAGGFAGARMIEQLKIVLHTVNFDICLRTGNVGPVVEAFNEDSVEKYKKQIAGLVEELTGKVDRLK